MKTGATPSIPAGRNGTSTFTGTFGGASFLRTVTEYHGGGKCLTRVQLRYRYVTTTIIVNLIVLTLLIYHFLKSGHVPLIFAIPHILFALSLFLQARRLKVRVRELVDFAGYRINMSRILRSRFPPQSNRTEVKLRFWIALGARVTAFRFA